MFDTDGVLTYTASVHAVAWKRLFDEYLQLRAVRDSPPFQPFTEVDYLAHVDGRPPLGRCRRLPSIPRHPAALG